MSDQFDHDHPYDPGQFKELLAIIEHNYNGLSAVLTRERENARNTSKELERQRDAHRKTLNKIADRLGTVYDDGAILAEVTKLDRAIRDPSTFQVVLLALAECALRRPGWVDLIDRLADGIAGENGVKIVAEFKKIHQDDISPIGRL